jgi:hypothetical protein
MQRATRTLLLLPLAMLLVWSAGCNATGPREDTLQEHMTPPEQGRVYRDQYGTWVLQGKPSVYQQGRSFWHVTEAVVSP